MYLEYNSQTKQVMKITETEPTTIQEGNLVCQSDEYQPGQEWTMLIHVMEVDGTGKMISSNSLRNTPQTEFNLKQAAQLNKQSEKLDLLMMMQLQSSSII